MPATASHYSIDRDEAVERLSALKQEQERRQCRRLHYFVQRTWHLVEPETPFVDNWHIQAICETLEQISAGHIKRIIFNVPPGTMKSLLINVMWRAWEWRTKPQLRYLTASYNGNLTIRDNLRLKAIVQSEWYQRLWPLAFKGDQNAKERFNTTEDGWCIATSVNGTGTGEHPDRIIIDDPTSAAQARSDTERDTANKWFDSTLSSRGVVRDVAVIVVMQRLHEEDLTGHLLARGGWQHVCFPMRWEPTRINAITGLATYTPNPMDPRREPGSLLWPALFTEAKVRQLELDLGPYDAAGQLQQRPAPEGGGLFKRSWFRFGDIAPTVARRVRGWDTGATEGGGDDTVGVRLAETPDGTVYVEDVVVVNVGPGSVDDLIYATAQLDGKQCEIREEQEPGSAGKAVIAARARRLKGFHYNGVHITGDKVTRAKPFRAQVEAGNVVLIRGPWTEAYLQELEHFPVGAKDNRVDGSSCAYNALITEAKRTGRATWGR